MRRRSLRLRLLVTFGLSALILSSMFASLTYLGVQHVLVSDQQQTDLEQSYVNAALIRSTLYTSPPQLAKLLDSIEKATASNVLVQTHHQWISKSHGAATNDVSDAIINVVDSGHATEQTLNIDGKIYRVESSVKVTVAKGTPFVKTKLRNLITEEVIEKNFKLDQTVQEVSLVERVLEFLYPEAKEFLFLDIGNLGRFQVHPGPPSRPGTTANRAMSRSMSAASSSD